MQNNNPNTDGQPQREIDETARLLRRGTYQDAQEAIKAFVKTLTGEEEKVLRSDDYASVNELRRKAVAKAGWTLEEYDAVAKEISMQDMIRTGMMEDIRVIILHSEVKREY